MIIIRKSARHVNIHQFIEYGIDIFLHIFVILINIFYQYADEIAETKNSIDPCLCLSNYFDNVLFVTRVYLPKSCLPIYFIFQQDSRFEIKKHIALYICNEIYLIRVPLTHIKIVLLPYRIQNFPNVLIHWLYDN